MGPYEVFLGKLGSPLYPSTEGFTVAIEIFRRLCSDYRIYRSTWRKMKLNFVSRPLLDMIHLEQNFKKYADFQFFSRNRSSYMIVLIQEYNLDIYYHGYKMVGWHQTVNS